MTTITLDREAENDLAAELRNLNRGQLTGLLASDLASEASAELQRRDGLDRARARRRADPVYVEWYEWAYAQYLQADRECRGELTDQSAPAHVTPWPDLWTGPEWLAEKWASRELTDFWEQHPRITITQYREQKRRSEEAHRDEHDRDELDRDVSHSLRSGTSGDAREGAPGRGRDRLGSDGRDPVSGLPAGSRTEEAGEGAGTDAGRSGDVRPEHVSPLDAARARLAERAAHFRGPQLPVAPASVPDGTLPGPGAAPGSAVAVRPGAGMIPPARQIPDAAEMLSPLLEQIGLYLMDYVSFPSRAAAVAVITWIAHAAARDESGELIWWASPRLLLTSAQNGSGKSTVLDLIAILLESRTRRMVKVTAYGLAQAVGTHHDVALPDDAQLTFGTTGTAAKEIQAVLLGGYNKGGTWVTGKSKGTVEEVYGPAAIAGKDSLIRQQAAALADLLARSVIVRMERPSRYMPQIGEEAWMRGKALATALKAVMGALGGELRQAVRDLEHEDVGNDITEGDGGRTAQLWRQLAAVARVAGGPWPAAITEAARELAAAAGDLLTAHDALAGVTQGTEGRSFWDEMA